MKDKNLYMAFNEETGKFEKLEKIEIFTTEQELEDTETIIVSKGALKVRMGRFVVYDIEYLMKHIDQEAELYGRIAGMKKEHDGCVNCKFWEKTEHEEPCRYCSHNFPDRWRAKE